MLKIVYFYQTPLLRIAAGTASPFITSRPMTTVKAAFFSLSTTIQMIATSEIRISVLVNKDDANHAIKVVHDKFFGNED